MQPLNSSGNPAKPTRCFAPITGHSLTKQSFQNDCNINNIMKKFEKTGQINHFNDHQGGYGEYIGYEDYHISLNKILEANSAFAALPSEIRTKFHNDPAIFLEYTQDPENLPELRKMGLAHPAPPEAQSDGNRPQTADPQPKDGSVSGDALPAPVAASAADKPAPKGG